MEKHGPNQWVLFHVEQWLRAPIQEYDGSLSQRTQGTPESIAKQTNSQLNGWMNYYGKFYRSEVTQVLFQVERHLRRWAQRKFATKTGKASKKRARRSVGNVYKHKPKLFIHWQYGMVSTTE